MHINPLAQLDATKQEATSNSNSRTGCTYAPSKPARRRLLTLALLTCCSFAGALAQAASHSAYDRVDPFIGTDNGGDTFPGAALPFGMIQWSPDTGNGFYNYSDKSIHGFSLTHLSGVGCSILADVPILPLSKSPAAQRDEQHAESIAFDHSSEEAHPGYYSVVLSDGSRVELTVAARSGIARITFPNGTHPGLLINGAGGSSTDVHMSFLPPVGREQDGEQMSVDPVSQVVHATITSGGFCGSPSRYTLHVAYQTQSRPTGVRLWQNGTQQQGSSVPKGRHAVAWLDLGTAPVQLVKVGLSYVSDAEAESNLHAEIPGWDFDAVRQHAVERWKEALGKVDIEGGADADQKIFYTGLYHMLLSQTLFSDADGGYMGFDGKSHRLAPAQHGQYTNISDWDTYRNTVQMHALLFPREASDLAQSLVNDAQQLGSFPRWPVANDSTYVMGGDSPPIIISSMHAFGAHDFDAKAALALAMKTATTPGLGQRGRFERDNLADYIKLGYIPSSNSIGASETLEFANADFAIAQLAKALGNTPAYEQMLRRSNSWRNLLDPETRWIRPRAADGTWIAGFDPDKSLPHRPKASVPTDQYGFEEGNTYQYTFMLPFDYAGLFKAIGDDNEVEHRLDRFFHKLVCWAEPCFNMANEPDFVTPYAYTFLGKPWKTAAVVRRIEAETFNTTPAGIPGNDDLGATSGVYVWNALGMYPGIPGLGGVILGSPKFKTARVHLGDGKNLVIHRDGDGPYVDHLEVNGARYTSSWLPASTFLNKDTEITFFETPTPGKSDWDTRPADLPPSASSAATR